jgi:hypothetical protein
MRGFLAKSTRAAHTQYQQESSPRPGRLLQDQEEHERATAHDQSADQQLTQTD